MLNIYSLSTPKMSLPHACVQGFSYKVSVLVRAFFLLHYFIKVCERVRVIQRQREETKKVKSKRANKRENMNPSHMKCNLIHFTVVPIERKDCLESTQGENLYTVLYSCECSQTAMLRGKLTGCLDCVPL